jgi:hypothetical protein
MTVCKYSYEDPINPLQETTPAGAKTEKVATPRGGKNASFPADLQSGFLILSGDDGSTTTMVVRRTGERPMGQLSWRYWRILMMLQRTTTTRTAATAGWEEELLSPSMPSWEHPPQASC